MSERDVPYVVATQSPNRGPEIEISGDGDDGAGASYVTLFVNLDDVDKMIDDLRLMKREAEMWNDE